MTDTELSPELDEFFGAYVTAALWSTTDNADDSGGEPLDANYDADDLSEECRAQMLADCRGFLESNAAAIGTEYAQAGHDFWLTRNRHGAGFWDRADNLYPGDKDELTEAAHAFGSVDLVVCERKIHHN